MSAYRQTRRRNLAIADLQPFRVSKVHEFTDGKINYGRPYYRVRPRGFDTVLMEIAKPAYMDISDFTRFMDAVVTITETGQK